MPALRAHRTVAGARMRVPGNGFAHSQVAEIQRARIVSAMFDVASERGAGNVTVAHVVERSGVSRRTFYELFADRDECFLAAFEEAVAYASKRVLPVYDGTHFWRARIRAALSALLAFFDQEPTIGRLLVSESLSAGPKALKRRACVLAQVTDAIDDGRKESKAGVGPPPLTAEGIVGGVLAIIHARMTEQGHGPLVELAGPLMSMIVLPYLGTGAARRELSLTLPVAASRAQNPTLRADPFKEAGMRLTYRTVRVLMTIADNPLASNRTIGDRAEIKDQGQISKLLARLERVGLVSNSGLGPGQGAPNAWGLTEKGLQVTQTIRAHAPHYDGEGWV